MVITFADISEIKAAATEREIQAARAYSDSIIDTIRQPLVVLDAELRVVSATRSFYRAFALAPGREPVPVEDYEIEIELPRLGRRVLLLNAREIHNGPRGGRKILLSIDDITERRQVTAALEAAMREAEQVNLGKSRFLAAASHDLRQPLQTISLLN